MVLIKERIGKLLEYLQELVYQEQVDITDYKMIRTDERFQDVKNLDTSSWSDFNHQQIWGGHREFYWFETVVTIPDNFKSKCVVYEVTTGKEGLWDATNPQFLFYVNGEVRQGLDVNHREVILTEKAVSGETFRILLSAFTGDQNFSLKLDSKLKVLDRKTEKYFYDLSVPYNVARMLNEEDKAYITIIQNLNESLNLLDLRKELSKEYYDSLEKAQEYITKEFYEKQCGDSEAIVYCVGHTHIDCAWLWTLKVTEDKAVRSFSTVLELMRRYPEYIFMSSQPQLYKYVKKNAPEVYEEIKQRVAEGRWEPEGGMFVEADCNIASGEALVRQFIHGQKFFKDEFGKDNSILWLPDVFGYSAALPQIMNKCGLPYFMTTKISWNEINKMPCDTFEWEGIDGSRVLTHFIPTRDYSKAAVEGGFETGHYTTYNGYINPAQVKGGWKRYSQKYLNNEVLMSFGFGDGGGGPTQDMLENQRRLSKGIPGCPKTVMSTAKNFFETLDKNVRDKKYLPSWVGELYLEYHRGTYTSMARNKKYNRKSEFAYQNAELYAMLNNQLNNSAYPDTKLHEGWEVILRNQFHDILPGSSIKEVYDDSKEEYEGILSINRKLVADSLKSITEKVNAPKYSLVVYNPNSAEAEEIVTFECPDGFKAATVYDGEKKLAVQKTADGNYIFKADKVPGKGYKTFILKEELPEDKPTKRVSVSVMENDYFTVEFNKKGQLAHIYDKRADREVLKEGQAANVIMSYEDRPHNYDAWDVNNYYVEKSWEVDQVESMEVLEDGPVRSCIKVERKYLDSTITQYIYMYQEIPRIDIKNVIDWKEHQIFVKTLFPVDIHSSEATFDIQYGNVKRPTHANTSWDFAKFEVCVHKWLDLSEDNYGVSMLNDCKYGCSVQNGVIGLSMLKSAIYPNPEADKEVHEFTYSFYPHQGDWREAGTVKQAYQINNPLTAVVKEQEGGTLSPSYSFVTSNQDNVIVEVVKKAEEDASTILRLYECFNRRTDAILNFGKEIASIEECNMMEEDGQPVDYDGRDVFFTIKPYEIKTLKVTFK
ncbi:alpha-mannosidase [Anaerocolumna sp. MB42-C2]|uniref:alpha-mannosidase n=1 Tax=Anaerocolumna sp. MB42-C2 TaxID=3070997 RepID=UPI0027DED467|nr:alpha-mannosidase [Anaerocolumna sp. MB42-C2]WMJ89726.1 alpha-mannosidase [Anaerocolumna sp. MB42-C2]